MLLVENWDDFEWTQSDCDGGGREGAKGKEQEGKRTRMGEIIPYTSKEEIFDNLDLNCSCTHIYLETNKHTEEAGTEKQAHAHRHKDKEKKTHEGEGKRDVCYILCVRVMRVFMYVRT